MDRAPYFFYAIEDHAKDKTDPVFLKGGVETYTVFRFKKKLEMTQFVSQGVRRDSIPGASALIQRQVRLEYDWFQAPDGFEFLLKSE
jgi:hypothetical protein